MTRKEALQELLVKVKAGECPSRPQVFSAFPERDMFDGDPVGRLFDWACDPEDLRAMGAALSLLEAVLPGYNYDIIKRGKRFTVHVYESTDCVGWNGVSDTPSRALLIAILNALVAMEDG
ncbi:MAG: hypothetical protein GY766_01695 [Herbaspirillum sp.]|uniref:hypothetical protein n=1 Tax=Herbaspirillum sp. TaxID=1890675 RepID=UPI002586A033|nr:hypothetical protein [Herbaspirillum sp.]MCP3653600.1 hypothetical protein [Herbaspirillum sp.]